MRDILERNDMKSNTIHNEYVAIKSGKKIFGQ